MNDIMNMEDPGYNLFSALYKKENKMIKHHANEIDMDYLHYITTLRRHQMKKMSFKGSSVCLVDSGASKNLTCYKNSSERTWKQFQQ